MLAASSQKPILLLLCCLQVRLSVVSHWHPLQQLHTLALIGLAFTAADAPALSAFLAAGSAVTLNSLTLGDQQGLSFLNDAALQGLGDSMARGARLQNLDLSGCIELTDAGRCLLLLLLATVCSSSGVGVSKGDMPGRWCYTPDLAGNNMCSEHDTMSVAVVSGLSVCNMLVL